MNTTTNTRGVSEAMRDAVAKAVADVIGHGMREKCYAHADAAIAALSAPEPAAQGEDNEASIHAIQFALTGEDGMAFLRCWNEGDFDACRSEWPEAPEACYVGADPLTAPPAQPAERVPDGWVLVPREPTDAMLSCLIDGAPSSWKEGTVAEFYGTREDMAENYKAMLAAAQQAAR